MKFLKVSVVISLLLLVFSFSANCLETSAKSAIVINADTFSVLYSHNINQRLPMASTTKIITALLLAEQNTPEKTVVATHEMVNIEGTSMGLKAGDIVTYRDLLYGILLPSGNDAANTAAIAIGGSIEKFAHKMNQKALSFGLHNTNFVTPSGLDADGHFTTAYDLAVITAYALRNKDFAAAASSRTAKVNFGTRATTTLTNHNKLLKLYDAAIGVKTGFTKKSGRCLVSAARRGNTTLIAVTLNDPNDWQDHINLLDYGFGLTGDAVILPEVATSLPVMASDNASVKLKFSPLNIGKTPEDKITYKVYMPQFLFSPVKQGDVIGYTEFYSSGRLIAQKEILADGSYIEENIKPSFIENIFKLFKLLLRCV